MWKKCWGGDEGWGEERGPGSKVGGVYGSGRREGVVGTRTNRENIPTIIRGSI